MKKIILFLVLALLNVSLYSQTVKVMYSSHFASPKGVYKDILTKEGLECEEFENTTLDNLNFNVDCILFSTVANYENTQDLSKYPFREFVEKGGTLIISDANYNSVLDFIPKTFGLVFKAGEAGTQGGLNEETKKSIPYSPFHPLLKDVTDPYISWSVVTDISPEFIPLYVDLEGRPVVAYKEVGKGLLIISTPYYNVCGFPSSQFVKNAINYAKSNKRFKEPKSNPSLSVNKDETIHKELYLLSGFGSNKTECDIKYNDNYLNINFKCYDTDLGNKTVNIVNRDGGIVSDDSLEVLIESQGSLYEFGVNVNNIQCDLKDGNKKFNTYWESEVSAEDGLWNANIKIPYSAFNLAMDDNQDFKINLLRYYHPNTDEKTLYSLVNIPLDKLMMPKYWQEVVLNDKLDLSAYRNDLSWNLKDKCSFGENILKLNYDGLFKVINMTTNETWTGNEGVCKVNFYNVGENQITCVAYDGDRCIGSTPIYNINVNDALSLDVIYPRYRDQVMSKDPNKKLRINVSSEKKYMVDFLIKGNDKEIYSKKYTIQPDKTTLISYDLGKLPVGEYSYIFKVFDDKDKIIREIQKGFRVLPPSDVEITFDEKNICYENGKPIFPIMLYHLGGAMIDHLNRIKQAETPALEEAMVLESAKERGFNLGHAQMIGFGIVDRYKEAGLNIVSEIGDQRDRGVLQGFVDAYNKNKNGLFYYTIDEPYITTLDHDIEIYNILKEIDPYRPCGAAVCNANVFKDAVKCFDILMPDAYVITNNNKTPSLNSLLGLLGPAREQSQKTGKPIWAVPQAFGWKNGINWVMPTCEQLRCEAYFYLVYGVTGLCWYAFASPEEDKNTPYNAYCVYDYPDRWDYFKVLNREISEFAEVLFKGESQGPLGVNDKVHSNVWKVGNKSYAIIVNAEPTEQSVSYKIKGGIKPFFESYSYDFTKEKDKVTFNLKPYECAIIEY
ncbi:MAG: hypothetical protein IJS60_00525 [Abditibacteriota bacterium]|nr:hypothetical protein [Abditibacteriota bacterium]